MQDPEDAKDRTVSVSECDWFEWPSGSGGAGLNLESERVVPTVHVLMSLHFVLHLICLFGMIFSSSFIVLREVFSITSKQS